MKWTKTSSTFTYSGKKVTRKTAISESIFGTFKVSESVSGKCFAIHPFMKKNPHCEWSMYETKFQCKNFEHGILLCENMMNSLKKTVNTY